MRISRYRHSYQSYYHDVYHEEKLFLFFLLVMVKSLQFCVSCAMLTCYLVKVNCNNRFGS